MAHRDKHVKASYESVFNRMVNKLIETLQRGHKQEKSVQQLSQLIVITLVGTISIARNLADSAAQQSLLDNTKLGLMNLLEMKEE